MVSYKFYILFKKKKKFKITSWSASLDLLLTSLWHPKWGFTIVFLSLHRFPAVSQQTASVPALPRGCPFAPLAQSGGAGAGSRSTAVGTRSALLCSALLTASRSRRAAAGPALPLLTGPRSSSANRCHFCLLRCWAGSCLCEKPGRAMLSEGQVIWGTGTECKLRDAVLSLSASNWKTTLFLAELSLGSFSVSL